MNDAILHREPAIINREQQRCEHVTTPRPAWWETERGKLLLIRRQLEGEHGFYIGKVINLSDGRIVARVDVNKYTVSGFGRREIRFKNLEELLAHLQTTGGAQVASVELSRPSVLAPLPTPPTARLKGVSYKADRKNHWRCEISVDGRKVYLGNFATPDEAAHVYDAYVIKHGLNRSLNFPQEAALEDVA